MKDFRPIYRLLFLVIAPLLAVQATSAAKINTTVVFVLYDAGETFALEPVMRELENAGVSYKTLVMGTAKQLLKNSDNILDINKDCEVSVIIDPQSWSREREISISDVEKLKECFEARVVIVGMASEVQHQLAVLERQIGCKVFAYYDGLAPLDPRSISHSFLPIASRVLVPSFEIQEQIKKMSPATDVVAVGQPTLEKWGSAKEQKDPKSIYSNMPFLDRNHKTLLYAGGYGDTYESAFSLFAQAAKHLSKYNILLSLHPKVDGALEKRILEKTGANNVVIIPKSISTMEAAIISDIVVSQSSTVGVQALFMGKPVLYLDVPGSKYSDVAISNGWAQQLFDARAFEKAVDSELHRKNRPASAIFSKARIPQHSANLIFNLIRSELKR